jgi:UDP-glucose 4-epimerase
VAAGEVGVTGVPAGRSALVTGGAGFIGSHLADRLIAEGWSVRVLDDFSSGRPENLARVGSQVELIQGDLCDEGTLAEAMDGVEFVFHQGAIPSVPRSVAEPLRTHRVNASGTLLVLEEARRAGVRRVVYASSSSAYGDSVLLPKVETQPPAPLSPYALQKYVGEVYCRLYAELYGLETVALRYFNVYGPRQDPRSEYAAVVPRFVTACLEGRAPTVFGDGEQTRDFTYVEDAVRANLLAASAPKAPGQVVNVAGGRRESLRALLAVIRDLTGARVAAVHAPARPGDVRDSQADLTRARELLGYQPAVSLREGLRRTIESFRSGGAGEPKP